VRLSKKKACKARKTFFKAQETPRFDSMATAASPAQSLFQDGVGLVLDNLRIGELVTATCVCKKWHKAAHDLVPRDFFLLLRWRASVPALAQSLLVRRHVKGVSVYPSEHVLGSDIARLAALSHLRYLSISLDGQAQASETFVFPPALVELRVKFVHMAERGAVVAHNREAFLVATEGWLDTFFSVRHFHPSNQIESLTVDMNRLTRQQQQLNWSILPRLRTFRYLVKGSLEYGVVSLPYALYGCNVWDWHNGDELDTNVLQPMSRKLPYIEALDLTAHKLLSCRFMSRLVAFRTSLTEISPRSMDEHAIPYLAQFTKLRRLVAHVHSNDPSTHLTMTGEQLLQHLPRSLTALTLSGITLTSDDRILFAHMLPHLVRLDAP
jgi:hypothetical protein